MKRKTVSNSTPAANHARSIDAHRLAAVRGGAGLGITVEIVRPPPHLVQMQHNETLIEL
jgi:hypothetical protein